MSKNNLTRRQFLTASSAGTLAAFASGGIPAYGIINKKATTLAILGGQPVRKKPLPSWPPTNKNIEKSLISAFRSGKWCRIQSGAEQVETFEKKFAELMGAKYCVATGAGTQALHDALHVVGVEGGDEVFITPNTYIASVQVILLCNALPVFVDIDIENGSIDPDKMEALINGNTKAIEPVHLGGYPVNWDKINGIAKKYNLKIVEDACQSPLAEWKGKKVGTLGDLGCFSLQASKPLPCGEGGAIVGNNEELMDKCYSYHTFGVPTKTERAKTDKTIRYTAIGTKYRMNEFEASVLLPQMETFVEEQNRRSENGTYLTRKLKEIPGIIPHKLYEGVTKATYLSYKFRYKKEYFNNISLDKFLEALNAEGISAGRVYPFELNKEPFIEHALNSRTFRRFYSKERLKRYREENECPQNVQRIKEEVSIRGMMFLGTKEDMDDIFNSVLKVYKNRDKLS